jgi:excisionase family DNA binding protein
MKGKESIKSDGGELVTVIEAARQLSLAPVTVRSWVGQRRIAAFKLGRAVRIPRDEIARILAESFQPADAR